MTANEDLRQLHPAVARPGRCSAAVEFTAFPADEAAGWLEAAGAAPERETATLATLYAKAQGLPLAGAGARWLRAPAVTRPAPARVWPRAGAARRC